MGKEKNIDKNEYSCHYFRDLRVESFHDYLSCGSSDTYTVKNLRMGLMSAGREYAKDKTCCVIRLLNGKTERIRCPFLYFTLPGSTIAWKGENGIRRENYRFDCCGRRAEELAGSLAADFPDCFMEITDDAPYRAVLEKMHWITLRREEEQIFLMPPAAEEFASLFWLTNLNRKTTGKYVQEIREDAGKMAKAPGKKYEYTLFAARLKITLTHYRKLFHQYMGMSPHEFLLIHRMILAKQLLLSGEHLRLKEIAEECGFSAASEFCRFFRAREGITPSQYAANSRD